MIGKESSPDEEILTPAGLGKVKIFTELGRFMLISWCGDVVRS